MKIRSRILLVVIFMHVVSVWSLFSAKSHDRVFTAGTSIAAELIELNDQPRPVVPAAFDLRVPKEVILSPLHCLVDCSEDEGTPRGTRIPRPVPEVAVINPPLPADAHVHEDLPQLDLHGASAIDELVPVTAGERGVAETVTLNTTG